MHVEFAFFCITAGPGEAVRQLIDATGIGIDGAWGRRFPYTIPTFALALKIRGEAAEGGRHRLHVQFQDSDGNDVRRLRTIDFELLQPMNLAFTENNLTVSLNNLTFPAPGTYHCLLTVDDRDEVLADLPLYVFEEVSGAP